MMGVGSHPKMLRNKRGYHLVCGMLLHRDWGKMKYFLVHTFERSYIILYRIFYLNGKFRESGK